ncbi:MAG: isoaspartyl peptidase/L-asparaginase family protein [Pyrinomonadaceae bacterium]
MKRSISLFLLILFFCSSAGLAQRGPAGVAQLQGPQNPRIGFVIHGGAGVIARGSLTKEQEQEYRDKLGEALMAGYRAMQAGKTSVDAVEIAIRILEDSPLFNAGKGAVFNADGKNELDASIMNGKTLAAGAVAGLRRVKNPITLARTVMEKSPHVMMIGDGAERFAAEQKLEIVMPKYFWTQRRWDELQRVQSPKPQAPDSKPTPATFDSKYGTVGAVALDKDGNLAAGTSTGGITNKKYGRVGDAPIIGAGTYANNNSCAVSATGKGEFFIRLSVARDICSLMEYTAQPVQQAADRVIKTKLQNLGGDGGVIAIDKFGFIGISFNTEGMYRAYVDKDGKPVVQIYKD